MSKGKKKLIPSTVRISPRTYQVVQRANLRSDSDVSLAGSIDYVSGTISIDVEMAEDRKREILCHEILHGMSTDVRANLTEKQVLRLGPAFCRFLDDNDWIKE